MIDLESTCSEGAAGVVAATVMGSAMVYQTGRGHEIKFRFSREWSSIAEFFDLGEGYSGFRRRAEVEHRL